MTRHVRIFAVMITTVLVVSALGLVGCSSSKTGTAGNTTSATTTTNPSSAKSSSSANNTTAEQGPSDRKWNMVAAVKNATDGSQVVTDANGTIEFSGSSISFSGSLGSGESIRITGQYDRTENGMYIYRLDNGAGDAGFGQSQAGSKPYAAVWAKPDGSVISICVEKANAGTNNFVGRWYLKGGRDAQGSFTAAQFEQAMGSFTVKFTPGGYSVMTLGSQTTFDVYSISGNTLTVTDAQDGSKWPFTLSGSTLKLDRGDMVLEFAKK